MAFATCFYSQSPQNVFLYSKKSVDVEDIWQKPNLGYLKGNRFQTYKKTFDDNEWVSTKLQCPFHFRLLV